MVLLFNFHIQSNLALAFLKGPAMFNSGRALHFFCCLRAQHFGTLPAYKKKPYVAHFLGKLVPKDKLVTVSIGKLAPVGK